MSYGGVYKLQIFSRKKQEEFFQKFLDFFIKILEFLRKMQFGIGILIKTSMSYGGVYKLQIFSRKKLKEFLRNF